MFCFVRSIVNRCGFLVFLLVNKVIVVLVVKVVKRLKMDKLKWKGVMDVRVDFVVIENCWVV